jgi:beta-galactosidase
VLDSFYYGVCYYPEAWDPSRHESDIRRIAACGFNVVRMGEGAWSYWEPHEGEFQFELFDRVIALCRRYGIKVILGTPTYAGPAWVASKYPEVLRWNFDRVPMAHGSRRFYNYTSPKYLELSDRICTALAEHYKDDDQVIAWQLDNEFNCHMDVSYAPSDTIAFRAWLKEKYDTIERLNDAWGARFWSQTYDSWDQIDLPHPTATYHNPTQLLDESRFISDCVVRFARRQADILRRANPRWLITHNGLFNNVNGPELVKTLDFFSHDQYPLFYREWTGFSFNLVQARSLSFPYAILEQQSGPGGQMEYLHRTPRPGEMRLWAWQSIAHGAKLLTYFRWRTCPYGSEQHWHGLLDADDRDNRRTEEAKQVGRELAKLPKEFFDAPVTRCAAVLRDFDNEINDRRINTYARGGAWERGGWLATLARRHIPHDIVWPSSNFEGYRLIIAPHLKITDAALLEKLTRFVRDGGTLVLGAQSGLKDRNCHIVEATPPGLLKELAGIQVEDWTTLAEAEQRTARFVDDAGETAMGTFVEQLRSTGAQVVAVWVDDDPLLTGAPAITRNIVGKGVVYYLGGYCPADAVEAIALRLIATMNIKPIVEAGPEVEAMERIGSRRRYISLFNHGPHKQVVRRVSGKELLSAASIDGEMALSAHGVAIIESA